MAIFRKRVEELRDKFYQKYHDCINYDGYAYWEILNSLDELLDDNSADDNWGNPNLNSVNCDCFSMGIHNCPIHK